MCTITSVQLQIFYLMVSAVADTTSQVWHKILQMFEKKHSLLFGHIVSGKFPTRRFRAKRILQQAVNFDNCKQLLYYLNSRWQQWAVLSFPLCLISLLYTINRSFYLSRRFSCISFQNLTFFRVYSISSKYIFFRETSRMKERCCGKSKIVKKIGWSNLLCNYQSARKRVQKQSRKE